MTRASIPTTTGQSRNVTRPDYWLAKFSKLRIDRARGDPAPHKPLLLLVLCDLVEQASLFLSFDSGFDSFPGIARLSKLDATASGGSVLHVDGPGDRRPPKAAVCASPPEWAGGRHASGFAW